jgi:hypothetical protein
MSQLLEFAGFYETIMKKRLTKQISIQHPVDVHPNRGA